MVDRITNFDISVSGTIKEHCNGKEYNELKYTVTVVVNSTHLYEIELSINEITSLRLLILENNIYSSLVSSGDNENRDYKLKGLRNSVNFFAEDDSGKPKLVELDLEEIIKYYKDKYIGAELISTKFSTERLSFNDERLELYDFSSGRRYHNYQMVTNRGTITFIPQHDIICGYSLGWSYVHNCLPIFDIKERYVPKFNTYQEPTYHIIVSIYCEAHCDTGYYDLNEKWCRDEIEEHMKKMK